MFEFFRSNRGKYLLLIISIAIIIVYVVSGDYNNFWSFDNVLKLSGPILIALAMLLSINHSNNKEK